VRLNDYVDEVLVVPEFVSVRVRRIVAGVAAFATLLIRTGVLAAIGIRAQHRPLGMVRLGDRLFAFFDLGGEGCLSRRLRGLRSGLCGVN
jgi:hypothetical protein